MVLLLPDGTKAQLSSRDISTDIVAIEHSAPIQAANEAFKNTVSGDVVAAHVKEIQVLQAECALVDLSCEPNDDVCLSSEEAATCCLVVLRCSISRRLFIAHLDESTCGDGATFRGALTGMQTPEVFIVGSYLDVFGTGIKVLAGLLKLLHFSFEQEIVLRLMCCGKSNTDSSGLPRTQRMCYATATQQCSCGPSPTAVPIESARNGLAWARAFSKDCSKQARLIDVYDTKAGTLVFDAQRSPLPEHMLAHFHLLLTYDHNTLLAKCSTSPNANTRNFTRHVQQALQWCIEHWENEMICFPITTYAFSEAAGWQMISTPASHADQFQYELRAVAPVAGASTSR